jgi:hypothetical protein
MTKDKAHKPPAFTLAMFLRALLFGGLMGLALLLLGAPLWTFYVGQISMAPLIFWELLHLDAKERRETEDEAPARSRGASRTMA